MGRKDPNKPKGAMSSYAFFVQTCREEHRKKHPGESVSFAEFSKKCSQRWREMGPKEKRRFEEMAERDKERFNGEMVGYEPPPGEKAHKRKRVKDPNAPKRSMSAFFFFCGDERPSVKAANPGLSVGEIAKILGKKWEVCDNKPKHEANAAKDKLRYEKAMAIYKGKKPKPGSPSPAAAPPPPPVAVPEAPVAAPAAEESDDSDSDEDDSSDDDDDDDDDE